jgi:hypothetical protein
MIQVRKIVSLAVAKIGAYQFGEQPDTATSEIVVDNLKLLLDEWDIRFANWKQYYETTTAKNYITLGTDNLDPLNPVVGDISARPAQITDVIAQIGSVNYPLNIKPFSEYNNIRIQNINAIPTEVYINYGSPFIKMYFYPGFGMSGIIKVIGKSYNTSEDLYLNDYIDFPREWQAAIVSNLALRIAPTFGIQAGTDLVVQASSDLKHIKQRQLIESMRTLNNDLNVGRSSFNILAGM